MAVDSLRLIMFVVALDERMLAQTGRRIELTSDDALQAVPTPSAPVETLGRFVQTLLNAEPPSPAMDRN